MMLTNPFTFEFPKLTDAEKEIIEKMKKDKFLMDNLELIIRGVLSDQFPSKNEKE